MTYRSTLTTLTALAGSLALTVGPATAGPAPSASSTTEETSPREAVLRSPPARCR